MKSKLTYSLLAATVAMTAFSGAAQAKGRLVVYCSATNAMCEEETKAFGEKYDVKTSFIRNGSGSTLAKVEAEKKNPQADVWYGGTLDPQSEFRPNMERHGRLQKRWREWQQAVERTLHKF